MKMTILYLFLFTYTTVMLRPLIPYVTDFVAHLLFFKDHMLKVHSHNGKFHVHTEVAEGAKNDQSEKSTNNLKKDASANEHVIIEIYKFPILQFPINFQTSLSAPTSIGYTNHDFPPPKV